MTGLAGTLVKSRCLVDMVRQLCQISIDHITTIGPLLRRVTTDAVTQPLEGVAVVGCVRAVVVTLPADRCIVYARARGRRILGCRRMAGVTDTRRERRCVPRKSVGACAHSVVCKDDLLGPVDVAGTGGNAVRRIRVVLRRISLDHLDLVGRVAVRVVAVPAEVAAVAVDSVLGAVMPLVDLHDVRQVDRCREGRHRLVAGRCLVCVVAIETDIVPEVSKGIVISQSVGVGRRDVMLRRIVMTPETGIFCARLFYKTRSAEKRLSICGPVWIKIAAGRGQSMAPIGPFIQGNQSEYPIRRKVISIRCRMAMTAAARDRRTAPGGIVVAVAGDGTAVSAGHLIRIGEGISRLCLKVVKPVHVI